MTAQGSRARPLLAHGRLVPYLCGVLILLCGVALFTVPLGHGDLTGRDAEVFRAKLVAWAKTRRMDWGADSTTDGEQQHFVVLTFVDQQYFPVLLNQLVAMLRFGPTLPMRLGVVCLDEFVERQLRKVGAPPCFPLHESGSTSLGSLWQTRVDIIRHLVDADISVLLTDTDAYWQQNPLPYLQRLTNVNFIAQRGSFPRDLGAKWGATACMGFAFFNASKDGTRDFMDRVSRFVRKKHDDQIAVNLAMDELGVSFPAYLQYELSASMDVGTAGGFQVALLPEETFLRAGCPYASRRGVLGDAMILHCLSAKTGGDKAQSAMSYGVSLVERSVWEGQWPKDAHPGGFLPWLRSMYDPGPDIVTGRTVDSFLAVDESAFGSDANASSEIERLHRAVSEMAAEGLRAANGYRCVPRACRAEKRFFRRSEWTPGDTRGGHVGLVAGPGAGNSWTGAMIQEGTRVFTGSVSHDHAHNETVPGEVEAAFGEWPRFSAVRDHFLQVRKLGGAAGLFEAVGKYDAIVRVVRSPFSACTAEVARQTAGHTGYYKDLEPHDPEAYEKTAGQLIECIVDWVAHEKLWHEAGVKTPSEGFRLDVARLGPAGGGSWRGVPTISVLYEDLVGRHSETIAYVFAFLKHVFKDRIPAVPDMLICEARASNTSETMQRTKHVSYNPFFNEAESTTRLGRLACAILRDTWAPDAWGRCSGQSARIARAGQIDPRVAGSDFCA